MIVWVEYNDEDGTKKQNELQVSDSELSVLLSSSHVTFPDAINPGNTNSFLMAKGEIIESTFVNTGFTNNKPYLKLTVNIVEKPVEF